MVALQKTSSMGELALGRRTTDCHHLQHNDVCVIIYIYEGCPRPHIDATLATKTATLAMIGLFSYSEATLLQPSKKLI